MTKITIESGQDIKQEPPISQIIPPPALQAKALKIITIKDFEFAGELLISLARIKKQINAAWKPMSDKAKASLREIKNNWDKELAPIIEAEKKISSARVSWKMEQDRLAKIEQERLERIAKEKAEKERQALLDKAAEMEKLNPGKAEAIFEKAEMIIENPVFIEKVVEKTTKMESGGSITWIKDIEVEVVSIRAVCYAVSQGYMPESCIEFKNLKQFCKLNNWLGNIHGLSIKEIQRESKRT